MNWVDCYSYTMTNADFEHLALYIFGLLISECKPSSKLYFSQQCDFNFRDSHTHRTRCRRLEDDNG